MNRQNRRIFLQTTAAAALASPFSKVGAAKSQPVLETSLAEPLRVGQSAPHVAANDGKKPLRLGLIIGIGKDPDAAMAKVRDLGLPTSQVFVDDFEMDLVGKLRQALEKHQIEATSVVVGGPGKEVWDFYQGPLTIGLVPREPRAARIAHIKKASDFAKQCGIQAVQTHCGFIPENPNDPVYKETIAAMKTSASRSANAGSEISMATTTICEASSLTRLPFRRS